MRFPLADFSTASGWEVLLLADIDSDLIGFSGGFACGGHAYLVPHSGSAGSPTTGSLAVRVDINDFTVAGTTVFDFADVHASLRGFDGGFCNTKAGSSIGGDGTFAYVR